jgi:hypothetical protein
VGKIAEFPGVWGKGFPLWVVAFGLLAATTLLGGCPRKIAGPKDLGNAGERPRVERLKLITFMPAGGGLHHWVELHRDGQVHHQARRGTFCRGEFSGWIENQGHVRATFEALDQMPWSEMPTRNPGPPDTRAFEISLTFGDLSVASRSFAEGSGPPHLIFIWNAVMAQVGKTIWSKTARTEFQTDCSPQWTFGPKALRKAAHAAGATPQDHILRHWEVLAPCRGALTDQSRSALLRATLTLDGRGLPESLEAPGDHHDHGVLRCLQDRLAQLDPMEATAGPHAVVFDFLGGW